MKTFTPDEFWFLQEMLLPAEPFERMDCRDHFRAPWQPWRYEYPEFSAYKPPYTLRIGTLEFQLKEPPCVTP